MNENEVFLGVSVMIVVAYLLSLLVTMKAENPSRVAMETKLAHWADKYADLKSEYLQADAERVEWKRMYEEAREKVIQNNNQWIKDFDVQIAENDRLTQEIERRKLTSIETQGYLDMLRSDYEKLRSELNEVLLERDAMKQKIESRQKEDRERAKLLYENAPALWENKRKQEEERRELEEKVVALESHLAEANDANRVIVDNQVQVAENYERRIAECQREIKAKCDAIRQMEKIFAAHEEELLQLRTEKEHLAKAIEAMQSYESGDKKATDQMLLARIDELKSKRRELEKQLTDANLVAERREEWIAELERANMPEIHRLEVELSRKDAENNSLKNQLEDLGEKYDATVAENDRLKSHGRELLESLDNTAAERDHNWQTMKQMEKERNELKLKCDKLKQENTRLIVDYGKAEHVTTDFRLDIDTQAFKDSLDLTVRRCEELKRAIVEANGGKRRDGGSESGVVITSVSPGIDWQTIGQLPPRSLDLEEIDSTVDADGGSVGTSLGDMAGSGE